MQVLEPASLAVKTVWQGLDAAGVGWLKWQQVLLD